VGDAPQSRDRGTPDVLRRDFVNDTTARTLRIAIPADSHAVHMLVGDATVGSCPTNVRSAGTLLAQSEQLASGEFAWLYFTVDGGSTGREVDLELSSVPDQHSILRSEQRVTPARPDGCDRRTR
jgi:alpha-glucuronidase